MTLYALMTRVHEINVRHGWDSRVPEDRSEVFGEKLMLVNTELAEAMEEFRNGRGLTEIYENGSKPEGIPIELADAIIRILDLAAANGMDLVHALDLKLAYNDTRPYRHGNKRA